MSRDANPLAISGNTQVCARCGEEYGSQLVEHVWFRLETCAVCETEKLCTKASSYKYLPRLPPEICARILREEMENE